MPDFVHFQEQRLSMGRGGPGGCLKRLCEGRPRAIRLPRPAGRPGSAMAAVSSRRRSALKPARSSASAPCVVTTASASRSETVCTTRSRSRSRPAVNPGHTRAPRPASPSPASRRPPLTATVAVSAPGPVPMPVDTDAARAQVGRRGRAHREDPRPEGAAGSSATRRGRRARRGRALSVRGRGESGPFRRDRRHGRRSIGRRGFEPVRSWSSGMAWDAVAGSFGQYLAARLT